MTTHKPTAVEATERAAKAMLHELERIGAETTDDGMGCWAEGVDMLHQEPERYLSRLAEAALAAQPEESAQALEHVGGIVRYKDGRREFHWVDAGNVTVEASARIDPVYVLPADQPEESAQPTDGWVTVPREPTEEMLAAGVEQVLGGSTFDADERHDMADAIYRAMLLAAPAPQPQEWREIESAPKDGSKFQAQDRIETVSLAEYARHQAETYHDENDAAAIAFRHIANCIDGALESADASGYARGRAEAADEIERLQHDIDRYIAIAGEEARRDEAKKP